MTLLKLGVDRWTGRACTLEATAPLLSETNQRTPSWRSLKTIFCGSTHAAFRQPCRVENQLDVCKQQDV
jgi:hypothetical protein